MRQEHDCRVLARWRALTKLVVFATLVAVQLVGLDTGADSIADRLERINHGVSAKRSSVLGTSPLSVLNSQVARGRARHVDGVKVEGHAVLGLAKEL